MAGCPDCTEDLTRLATVVRELICTTIQHSRLRGASLSHEYAAWRHAMGAHAILTERAPAHRAGPFSLEIDGAVSAFKAARPAAVVLSSAGVERNAVIGHDEEARKKDIPIVQLNPGGTLAPSHIQQLHSLADGPVVCLGSTSIVMLLRYMLSVLSSHNVSMVHSCLCRDP